ncbi:MAG: PKD domain-containing protein, partial [Methanobacteriota archaeon]
QNQQHTYNEPGTYTAVLTVSGPAGQDTTEKTINVAKPQEPDTPPKAAFTTDQNEGVTPLPINFTDVSTGTISEYKWDFGDGKTATDQNQQHTYNEPGTYTAVLTVSGPAGQDTTEKTINVAKPQEPDTPPKAAFTTDQNEGVTPLPINFTDASTGTISEWSWDFGDGSYGVGQTQHHTYTVAGTYTASLTITGPGGEDQMEQNILVKQSVGESKKAQLKAAFSTYSSQGPAPFSMSFLDTSTGGITDWNWDFGDGATSTEQSPRHTYTTPGTYPAYLTVIGPSGQSRTDATLVLVTSSLSQPWSAFTTDRTEGYAPLSVRFSDTSSGEITDWKWDFGDGSTATGNQSDHTYTTPGSYTGKLIVKGPGGESRSETLIHVMEPEAPPTAGLTASVTQGQAPLTITFTDSSSGTITSWNWDFGDGANAAEQNSTHTYTNPGYYKAGLTIEGPGGIGSTNLTITVTEGKKKPSADFTADITNGSLPFRVHLHPVTTGEVDGYFWDLGDGTVSYDEEPVHTYETIGDYQVSLTVSGPGGVTTTKKPGFISTISTTLPVAEKSPAFIPEPTLPVTEEPDVPVHPKTPGNTTNQSAHGYPVISITGDYTSGPAPLRTSFQTNVTGTIDGYVWDFGDGGSSYDQSPIHIYAIPGNYSVKLIVTGPDGISEVKVPDPIIVTEGMKIPVASFSAEPISGYTPLVVNFTDESSGSVDKYLWNLGDGTTSTEKNPQHLYASPGTYSVGLKVSGQSGSADEEKNNLIVVKEKPAPPVARFKADSRTGQAPLVVTFQDMASGVVTGWIWDLGDGNISSERDPVNTYNRPGVYSVSQTVEGPGGKDSAIRRGYITVSAPKSPPSAAIYAEPLKGSAPLPVKFLDMSSGTVSSWNWDLGDGMNSTDKNPTHIYQNPGTYKIRLQVDGAEGQSTSELIIRVSSPENQIETEPLQRDTSKQGTGINNSNSIPATQSIKPIANFTVSEMTGTAPLKVAFQDTSVGEITQWVWSFGDGEFADTKDPIYTYQKPGAYTVSLTVTGPHGSSSKRSREAIEVS